MDSYSASEDPGPTFCIGHHEANRSVTVTPQMIIGVHETNVSSRPLSCGVLLLFKLTKKV